ncbi:MAG: ABC transporter permease [Clostridiaceae bacterium]
MIAILKKEIRNYFTTLTGYIFITLFILVSGIFFVLSNIIQGSNDYNSVLYNIIFIFIIAVPILTMGILSEERKNKTEQLLLTYSINVSDIVFGKFLAAIIVYFITLIITLVYPIVLNIYSSILIGEIFSGYIGVFLLGISLISIGIFISSLTENQMIAAGATIGILLIIWISDWIIKNIPNSAKAGLIFSIILLGVICLLLYYILKNSYLVLLIASLNAILITILSLVKFDIFIGFIAKFFRYFSLFERFNLFNMGIISLDSIVYYLSFTFIMLLLTVRIMERRICR